MKFLLILVSLMNAVAFADSDPINYNSTYEYRLYAIVVDPAFPGLIADKVFKNYDGSISLHLPRLEVSGVQAFITYHGMGLCSMLGKKFVSQNLESWGGPIQWSNVLIIDHNGEMLSSPGEGTTFIPGTGLHLKYVEDITCK